MGLLGDAFALLLRRWCRYRVVGQSMRPTLSHGDLVWVDPQGFLRKRPRVGQIVVARHPYRTNVRLVKRLVRDPGAHRFFLGGDNPDESTDSRTFGTVPGSLLVGPVRLGLLRDPLRILRFDG